MTYKQKFFTSTWNAAQGAGSKPCLSPSAFFSLIHCFHSCDPQATGQHVHQRQLKPDEVTDISTNNNSDISWHLLIQPALQWSRHTRYPGSPSSEKAAPAAVALPLLLCPCEQHWLRAAQSLAYTGGQAAQSQPCHWPWRPGICTPSHFFYMMLLHFGLFPGDLPLFHVALCRTKLWHSATAAALQPQRAKFLKKSHFSDCPRLLLWPLGVQHYSSNWDFPKQGCPWCLHKFHGHCNKCRLVIFI